MLYCLILFSIFTWYMWYLYKHEKINQKEVYKMGNNIVVDIIAAFIGIMVLAGSSFVVLNAVEFIVKETGIGGSLIGVLTLGVASALPEFFTAMAGVRKKAADISIGTLIGSNITNPLFAIGLGALLSTYYVPKPLVYWDLPMATITAALLLLWLLFSKRKLGRYGAIYLMGLYLFYAAIRIMFFTVD